ncbi:histidine kinase [Chitinophaga pendula]|uniref:sensor histidine kinase n=1 Tax=Chitinophaga TaxID=79328 RepID=UPI000BAFBED5|nr:MULTISPECIES: histidine kinase [Chitinophaga]ASZ12939.1 hypothetical protein CK934_19235 [Chitinophaga sp. MD30]UCJ09432.1 histidine kinase [Chitinophaga pendula]
MSMHSARQHQSPGLLFQQPSPPIAPPQWLRQLCTANRFRWLRHTLFITLFVYASLSALFHLPIDMEQNIPFRNAVRWYHIGNMLTSLLFVYINIWILVPHLLYRGRYLQYGSTLLLMLLSYFFICFWMDRAVILPLSLPQYLDRHLRLTADEIVSALTLPLILMIGTTGIKVLSAWLLQIDRVTSLENMQLKYELSQLKNMVSPHFLFNTLNNLQILIHTNTNSANDLLQGLSDILHYQVYDCTAEKVFLDRELRFFRHLLQLEAQRRHNWHTSIDVQGDTRGIRVYPHLFIPFIENAVKYADTNALTAVTINFHIHPHHLVFRCTNGVPAHPPTPEKGRSGAGLQYARRRLDLLFGNNYTLNINTTPATFTVQLELPL